MSRLRFAAFSRASSLLETLIIIITRKILEFAKVRGKKFVSRENCPGTFEFYVAISAFSLSLSPFPYLYSGASLRSIYEPELSKKAKKSMLARRRGPMSLPGNIIIGRYFRFYEEEQKQLPQSRCRQSERLIVASESDKDDEGRRNREGVSRGYTPLSAREEAASTDISGKSKQERNNITG